MVNSKNAFWQALILAIIIFVIGAVFGLFLEKSRFDKAELNLVESEISLLDEQLRNRVVDNFNVSCLSAKESLFEFADNIYFEALNLEDYDSSAKFIGEFSLLHKKYDLLRTMLWLEGARLKQSCLDDFHTITYVYAYENEDIKIRANQIYFSRLLIDLKNKYPDQILLIPIAGDLDLKSIDLILENYDVEDFPVIIIDEKEMVNEIVSFEELEKIVFEGNKQYKA